MARVGLRREDKSPRERRIPLIPQDIQDLRAEGLDIVVQSSEQRVFRDEEFAQRDIPVVASMADCGIVMGVKEIPVEALQDDRTYVFFSHVIKGQPYNMPMLRRMMELGCTLIDYERIADEAGRRLVAFGFHAGAAGAVDTLWTLGQRWRHAGRQTPLDQVRPAHAYESLVAAKEHLAEVARACRSDAGFRDAAPVVVGVTGYGRVAGGAHDVFDALGAVEVSPEELGSIDAQAGRFVRVRFEERHFSEPIDANEVFSNEAYYQHPERMHGIFGSRYLPHLTVLLNAIYWEPRYPRLVTKGDIRALYAVEAHPRLEVIGDVSCDIEGSVEITVKATDQEQPVFTWDVRAQVAEDGFIGRGPTIMAVDILPTELPREASEAFSSALKGLMPSLAGHDFRSGLEGLPPELLRAAILDRGRLTPDYQYLEAPLADVG